MDCTIRRAAAGDEAALAYIQTESWKVGFRDILREDVLAACTDLEKATRMYRRLLAGQVGNGYLLEVEGQPRGIAWWDATREKDLPGYGELICIHSLPGRWRQGYGSRMMEQVLADMKAAGYGKVMLWVFAENSRARGFYEAHGFWTEGKEKPGIQPVEICYERSL